MKKITKIKLGLASVGLAGTACLGSYVYGQFNADAQRLKELEASNKAQAEYIEQLKAQNIKYEKFVTQVSNETELILFTEEGITNTVIENGSNFLTHTKTEFAIEYRIKLGIKTSAISYYIGDEGINIVINRDNIEVSSLDDEKIAAEKLICDKAKEEVLKDNSNIDMAINGFSEYMNGLAKVMDVDINIIIH